MSSYDDANFGKGNQDFVLIQNSLGHTVDYEGARSFIVPIFKQDLTNGDLVSFMGTGFLITRDMGIIISAKHVLDLALDEKGKQKYGLIIFQIKNKILNWRPIIKIGSAENSDVGIGLCANLVHKETGEAFQNSVPVLSSNPPRIGESLFTLAYPGTSMKYVNNKTHIGIPLEPYTGYLKRYHRTNTDDDYVKKMMSLPCYETTIQLHSGSSGGPVFDRKGRIIGINHRGFSYDEEKDSLSWFMGVNDLFDFKWCEELPTIKDLSNQGIIAIE